MSDPEEVIVIKNSNTLQMEQEPLQAATAGSSGSFIKRNFSSSSTTSTSSGSIKFSIPSASSSSESFSLLTPTPTPSIKISQPTPTPPEEDDNGVDVVPSSDPEDNDNEDSTPNSETNAPRDQGMDLEDNLMTGLGTQDSSLQSQDELMEEEQLDLFRRLKRFGPNEKLYPTVRPSHFQIVAFKVEKDYRYGNPLEPAPLSLQDIWDENHVPMPFSDSNTHTKNNWLLNRDGNGSGSSGNSTSPSGSGGRDSPGLSRWITKQTIKNWDVIQRSLRNPITCFDDLSNIMNAGKKFSADLNVLRYAIECIMTIPESQNFYTNVLPFMVQLSLDLPKILTCPLPLLKRFKNLTLTLSQKQIGALLANAFFSTFPNRLRNDKDFPTINFKELLTSDENDVRFFCKAHKLRCLLHYFERICDQMPVGAITFTRRNLKDTNLHNWETSTCQLNRLVILSNGTIENEGAGMLQVDFANRFVGGGVLGRGTVQEEILFVTYPEMMVSRLFTDKLFPNEALIMSGCERYSCYTGYAETFEYTGDYIDCTGVDEHGRRLTQWVAIDALYIRNSNTQFHPKYLTRELNKAYVGFFTPNAAAGHCPAVASGKWGCGAFNGDPELKAILQLMSASACGRDLAFFCFGDTRLQRVLVRMYEIIKDKNIHEVWGLLKQYFSLFCSSYNRISLSSYFEQYVANNIQDEIQDLSIVGVSNCDGEITGEFPDD